MSDFIDQVTAIRTRLRELKWACEWDAGGGWSTGRWSGISCDIAEAIRALGRAGAGYPVAAEQDLTGAELLAGLRAARDELEALVLADHDARSTVDIASAGFSIARAVMMLVKTIAREARQGATIRALHAGAGAPVRRVVVTSELGR